MQEQMEQLFLVKIIVQLGGDPMDQTELRVLNRVFAGVRPAYFSKPIRVTKRSWFQTSKANQCLPWASTSTF